MASSIVTQTARNGVTRTYKVQSIQAVSDPDNQPTWPRNKQMKDFFRVMRERGLLSTHKRLVGRDIKGRPIYQHIEGYTGTMSYSYLKDPRAKKLLTMIRMNGASFKLRWRKDPQGFIYARVTLNLRNAHLPLSDWPGLSVYFDYGRSWPEPDEMRPGLNRYYHGSPHLVLEPYEYWPDGKKGRREVSPQMELGRLREREDAFSTYFWVDFRNPEDVTYLSMVKAVDGMLNEALDCAKDMQKIAKKGAVLWDEVAEVAAKGCVKLAKGESPVTNRTLARLVGTTPQPVPGSNVNVPAPGSILLGKNMQSTATRNKARAIGKALRVTAVDWARGVWKILPNLNNEQRKPLVNLTRWAAMKQKGEVLNRLRKLQVDAHPWVIKRYGSMARAVITIKFTQELLAEYEEEE